MKDEMKMKVKFIKESLTNRAHGSAYCAEIRFEHADPRNAFFAVR